MKKIICITIAFLLFSFINLMGDIWEPTGFLNQGRSQFSSVGLNDDRVLVAGGSNSGPLSSCEIYDPNTGQWTTTDSMNYARTNFSLTKLSNGMVLAIGGFGYDTAGQTGEIFDPTTETWGELMTLNYSRYHHASVLLQNGKVLIVGGDSYNDYQGCEIYDPGTEMFTLTGFCIYPKFDHTLELLPSNGYVMAIAGGSSIFDKVELYDVNTETWSELATLSDSRDLHTSQILPNGNVIVIGGSGYNGSPQFISSCEIYDFATEQWTFADSLEIGRTGHCSKSLLNNKILAMCGLSDEIGTDLTCESYDPETNEWENAPSTYYPYSSFSTEILFDERVLAIRSWCEIYTWNYMPIALLQGPTSGNIGEELNFAIVATDPDGDSVSVRIDWGDDEFSQWTGLEPSGATFELSHSYTQYGQYEIRAQVADQWYFQNELCHNSISEWGNPLIVNITGIPIITTLTEFLDFGFVYIGEDSTLTITISNSGNGILEAELSTGTNEFSVYPENFNLEPEDSLEIEVTFTPIYEGVIIDTLIISSNDPENPEIEVFLTGEGVIQVSADNNQLPTAKYDLCNYPNPFNPTTEIRFQISDFSEIESAEIAIYNLKGQKVKTFTFPNGSLGTSERSVAWDGTDDSGKPVSSGIYFARLKAGKIELSRKMLLMK
ncbi:MAG: kelch repeat-containing protein [Candidatus Cloacimonadales bacterium]|nr:kelch repeat-containing protein [Candidatus Cloacimonadales bacterium]